MINFFVSLQIIVQLDAKEDKNAVKEEKPVLFKNVLANECYDVIGDASPSVNQVSLGTRVCVRHNQGMFVEGVVCTITDSHPVRFVVAALGDQQCEITVNRI